MDRTVTRVFVLLIVAVALVTMGACGFLGGVLVERQSDGSSLKVPGPTSSGGSGAVGDLIDEAQGILNDEALEPSTETSMTNGAVQGLLDSLGDPYATYFDPESLTAFRDDQRGEFFGIGISVQVNDDGQPFVVKPFEDTPASRAGLKAGDVISAIDGQSKKKWDIDEVVKLIRGPKGTKVKLKIERKGRKAFVVSVERDKITVPTVMSRKFGKDVGYIRLMGFNEQADVQVREAITKLDKQGAKGYIIDLRENPGGLLDQAVKVSSLFVPDGVIVRIDERGKPQVEERATGEVATDKPVVVLVDENSASASEIVAAALQDYKRATLVGQTTYGKGSVQTIRDLDNGGAIKFTTAHYLSPKSRVINKKGVTPDVVIKMDPKLQAKDTTDTQLKKAIIVLRGLL